MFTIRSAHIQDNAGSPAVSIFFISRGLLHVLANRSRHQHLSRRFPLVHRSKHPSHIVVRVLRGLLEYQVVQRELDGLAIDGVIIYDGIISFRCGAEWRQLLRRPEMSELLRHEPCLDHHRAKRIDGDVLSSDYRSQRSYQSHQCMFASRVERYCIVWAVICVSDSSSAALVARQHSGKGNAACFTTY